MRETGEAVQRRVDAMGQELGAVGQNVIGLGGQIEGTRRDLGDQIGGVRRAMRRYFRVVAGRVYKVGDDVRKVGGIAEVTQGEVGDLSTEVGRIGLGVDRLNRRRAAQGQTEGPVVDDSADNGPETPGAGEPAEPRDPQGPTNGGEVAPLELNGVEVDPETITVAAEAPILDEAPTVVEPTGEDFLRPRGVIEAESAREVDNDSLIAQLLREQAERAGQTEAADPTQADAEAEVPTQVPGMILAENVARVADNLERAIDNAGRDDVAPSRRESRARRWIRRNFFI